MPASVKPSRLLLRLDREIAVASSGVEADCKRAERAAYLARLGHSLEAKAELDALRRRYDLKPHAEVSAWLNLVEGLVAHFGEMNPEARGKVMRSHALSSAAGLSQIQAHSAAWLAHMDYLRLDSTPMVRHAAEALNLSTECHHSVRSRVSLVLAQAYHFAGRLDLALPWYGSAHDHSVADGDDATLSAVMHNMAWLKAQRLRATDCGLSVRRTGVDEHALMAAESTANFDSLIGSKSLPALVPILRAQILTARGDYADALALFEAELSSALRDGMKRLHADILADQAWCRVQLGQRSAAMVDAALAEESIDVDGQFDDRALAYARLAKTFEALFEPDKALAYNKLAKEAWVSHNSVQERILEALAGLGQLRRP